MVVRYGCFVGKDDYEKMAPADNGAWVKYEYHIQRIAELEHLLQAHQARGNTPAKENWPEDWPRYGKDNS